MCDAHVLYLFARSIDTLPQHVRMGLAIYTLGHDCVGAQTVMNNLAAPLLRVAEAKAAVLDLSASDISAFDRQLEAPVFARLLQHLNVQLGIQRVALSVQQNGRGLKRA